MGVLIIMALLPALVPTKRRPRYHGLRGRPRYRGAHRGRSRPLRMPSLIRAAGL